MGGGGASVRWRSHLSFGWRDSKSTPARPPSDTWVWGYQPSVRHAVNDHLIVFDSGTYRSVSQTCAVPPRCTSLVLLGCTQVAERHHYSNHDLNRSFMLGYTCRYSSTCVSQLQLVKALLLTRRLVGEEPRCEALRKRQSCPAKRRISITITATNKEKQEDVEGGVEEAIC